MSKEITREMLRFIETSPTPYHAVANMAAKLEEAGFRRLYEEEKWDLEPEGRYYVTRSGTAVIAFVLQLGLNTNDLKLLGRRPEGSSGAPMDGTTYAQQAPAPTYAPPASGNAPGSAPATSADEIDDLPF